MSLSGELPLPSLTVPSGTMNDVDVGEISTFLMGPADGSNTDGASCPLSSETQPGSPSVNTWTVPLVMVFVGLATGVPTRVWMDVSLRRRTQVAVVLPLVLPNVPLPAE